MWDIAPGDTFQDNWWWAASLRVVYYLVMIILVPAAAILLYFLLINLDKLPSCLMSLPSCLMSLLDALWNLCVLWLPTFSCYMLTFCCYTCQRCRILPALICYGCCGFCLGCLCDSCYGIAEDVFQREIHILEEGEAMDDQKQEKVEWDESRVPLRPGYSTGDSSQLDA